MPASQSMLQQTGLCSRPQFCTGIQSHNDTCRYSICPHRLLQITVHGFGFCLPCQEQSHLIRNLLGNKLDSLSRNTERTDNTLTVLCPIHVQEAFFSGLIHHMSIPFQMTGNPTSDLYRELSAVSYQPKQFQHTAFLSSDYSHLRS